MKKCLFVTTEHSVFRKPIENALQRVGFIVETFDYRGSQFLARDSTVKKMTAALPLSVRSRLFHHAEHRINRSLVEAAQTFRPDLIFVIKGKELTVETIEALNKIAVTANWYPETIDHWGGIMAAAPHYTYFFSFDQIVIDRLRQAGIHSAHYLPFCADVCADDRWPQENTAPEYNVVFIGTYHPERADREHLLAKFVDYGLDIWGSDAWKRTSLRNFYRGTISNEGMIDVYRRSRIVINHYITGLPGSGINLRPFEVTGAGALLVNHDGRSDIFRMFRAGEEFIPFSGVSDILQKVEPILTDESERRRIARNGFNRTRRDHTYDGRIATILAVMQNP